MAGIISALEAESPMQKPVMDERSLSLQKWLELIGPHANDRDYQITDYRFPTDALRDEYLASVHTRSDIEVKSLLRKFLVKSGSLGIDEVIIQAWLANSEMLERAVEHTEFAKRLTIQKDPLGKVTPGFSIFCLRLQMKRERL
jgi:restriction system protein